MFNYHIQTIQKTNGYKRKVFTLINNYKPSLNINNPIYPFTSKLQVTSPEGPRGQPPTRGPPTLGRPPGVKSSGGKQTHMSYHICPLYILYMLYIYICYIYICYIYIYVIYICYIYMIYIYIYISYIYVYIYIHTRVQIVYTICTYIIICVSLCIDVCMHKSHLIDHNCWWGSYTPSPARPVNWESTSFCLDREKHKKKSDTTSWAWQEANTWWNM